MTAAVAVDVELVCGVPNKDLAVVAGAVPKEAVLAAVEVEAIDPKNIEPEELLSIITVSARVLDSENI